MKNSFKIVLTVFLVAISIHLSSQCLPQGITFQTQEQINSFQTNYPGCTEIEGDIMINGMDIVNLDGLSVLTDVGGMLSIKSTNIVNLNGLSNLAHIGDDLYIDNNNILESLSGLQNLEQISGNLIIGYVDQYDWVGNTLLSDISYLSALTTIGGILDITGNHSIINLEGFNALISVNDGIKVFYNENLTDITAFNNLSNISGTLEIASNALLTGLEGMENLEYIEGDLLISVNESLANIDGFSNLNSIGGDLDIYYNNALNDISSLTGLTEINGDLIIEENNSLDNLTGLENITNINGKLELLDNLSLSNLAPLSGLDSVGGLNIGYSALSDLSGLENLTHIGGHLSFGYNNYLVDITALESLTSVEGGLGLYNNPVMEDLQGLGNILTLSQGIDIWNCEMLQSLNGLNLTSLGGVLKIEDNVNLTDLSALSNINAGSIEELRIIENPNLSSCEVEIICNYLDNPNGITEIRDNAAGCNTIDEVVYACETIFIEEREINETMMAVSVYPNPVTSLATIELILQEVSFIDIGIYDITGMEIEKIHLGMLQKGEHSYNWIPNGMKQGIYLLIVKSDKFLNNNNLLILNNYQ